MGIRYFGKAEKPRSAKVIGPLQEDLFIELKLVKDFLNMKTYAFPKAGLVGTKARKWSFVSAFSAIFITLTSLGALTSADAATKLTTYKLIWSILWRHLR